jgi:pilus assembly protein CpaE
MTAIRTTLAIGAGVDRRLVERALHSQPVIEVDELVNAGLKSLGYLESSESDAIVVFCREGTPELLQFIHGVVAQQPDRPVIVHYEGVAHDFVRRAFDAGAEDLLTGRLDENGVAGSQVAFALEKSVARRGGVTGPDGAGGLVTVLGPKGGTGKTLVCCNLGVAIAARQGRAILVDLDLQFGDVGLALGLRPDRTLYDLAMAGGSLDPGKIEDFLVPHESGLKVLMAPRRPDQATSISTAFLEELFSTLREMADLVIVDTPPSFAPEVITAIDASTQLLAVAMLDTLSLKNTRLALETLELMHVDPARIKVVLNRADSRVGVTVEDAGQLLGNAPDVLIPSSREISKSVNEAQPIVLSHANDDARRAFESLAHMMAPRVVAPATGRGGRRRRLLNRRVAA